MDFFLIVIADYLTSKRFLRPDLHQQLFIINHPGSIFMRDNYSSN